MNRTFIALRLKADTLSQYQLPDIDYPIPSSELQMTVTDGGDIPFASLLYWLQEDAEAGETNWRDKEQAMSRLAELLAPHDERPVVVAEGDDWWLEIGPVDTDQPVVTIQRDGELVAALSPTAEGRLRVATYRPLDGKSCRYLYGLAVRPHPDGGVCMRENNWEYALDASAANGNHYAAERGEAYLSHWEHGIGRTANGVKSEAFDFIRALEPRIPSLVATELGVHYVLDADSAETTEPPEATNHRDTGGCHPTIPVWPRKKQQKRTIHSRFLGCLLGGAVGDALGAPVEFMKRKEILERFGPRGITGYTEAYGRLGAITDDTQMTLFTAEGLLRGWVRGCLKGITSYPGTVAHAYLRWLRTQGEANRNCLEFGQDQPGWLLTHRELYARRAPGNTCLAALRDMEVLDRPARNNSKGCGGVMRVAPAGLFSWQPDYIADPFETFRLGTELAALTHGHPTGSLTGGVLAVLIQALLDGASLPEALGTAKTCLRLISGHEETLQAIELAEALATCGMPSIEAIARLGEGWVAEEALAISIYCSLVAKTFRQGVLLAVNHDGDSDSTGAITGNLLGTIHRDRGIPERWLEALELREVTEEISNDLHAYRSWIRIQYDPDFQTEIWSKYPGF